MYKKVLFLIIVSFHLTYTNCSAQDVWAKYYTSISQCIGSSMNDEWKNWCTLSIISLSRKYQIDPLLVTANIAVESNFNVNAVSGANAYGLSQLTLGTANQLGVDPYDVSQNLEGGVMYLKQLLDTFEYANNWKESLAIAAYNAGPEAVKKYKGIPPYEETINHVHKVGQVYEKLKQNFLRS